MEKDRLTEVYCKLLNHFGQQNWWPTSEEFFPEQWEIMIGAILTQNTSWKNVEKALGQLAANDMTTIADFTPKLEKEIKSAIKPSGYYRQKYDRIMRLVDLIESYQQRFELNSKREALNTIKRNLTREELLEIKGIGPETADAVLLYAFNHLEFVIDAYTRRILKRLELADGNESYNQLKELMEQALEEDLEVYQEFHALLDELAKNYCSKQGPKCPQCPLSSLCPFCSQERLKID